MSEPTPSSTDRESRYLAGRAATVKQSIRTRMLQLSADMDDLVALGRGDPDFDTPATIIEKGVHALQGGDTHYTPPAGLPELRQAVAAKLHRDNQLKYPAEQILITSGCQEALVIAILALVDPGDEVVLQAPRFNAFDEMVKLAGGRVVDVPTLERDDFALKADSIRRVLTDKTKLLVVANPNNPTGALINREDLVAIADVADEHDLLVISDEIYEKIIFDGAEHVSLAGLGKLMDRTVTVNGFSKAYAMTGWRVGYLAAPSWFMEPAIEIKHSLSICTPPAMQRGALAALDEGDESVSRMVAIYRQRRSQIMQGLDELEISYGHPGGGMYIYANVSSTGLDAETFCYELLRQEHVMIFPGTMFADPGNQHVRITLLSPQPMIDEALRRLSRFVRARRP